MRITYKSFAQEDATTTERNINIQKGECVDINKVDFTIDRKIYADSNDHSLMEFD